MLKIGLTGGIASGKSTVSGFFAEMGIPVIDADNIARSLFAPNSPHLDALRKKFGDAIFTDEQTLDRAKLRSIVFADKNALRWLNEFTHPLVRDAMQQRLDELASQSEGPAWALLDIPLLIDANGAIPDYLRQLIDKIIVIDIDPEIQMQRVMARDDCDKSHARQILANQASREQRLAHADYVLTNNRTKAELKSAVIALNKKIMQSIDK